MKPLFLHLVDQQYPMTQFTHTRKIVRGMVMNDQYHFAFNHIMLHDKFGQRNYLETPGGGVDEGESLESAMVREIEEELGYQSEVITYIGQINDDYNLIHRHNEQYFYVLKTTKEIGKRWTEQEKTMIQEIVWLSIDEAIDRYQQLPNEGISQLIKQRELPVLLWVKAWLENKEDQ
jgi:8-oxo-dGTP diphosphatase